MSKKAKKFDTNPLDPDFPERVLQKQKERETASLGNQNGKTQPIAEPFKTEEQTKKFSENEFDSYHSSLGENETQLIKHQPKTFHSETKEKAKSLSIGSISLPENILTALPYIPFAYIGIIAGIIELIFIPKSEPKVRYHAAQGLAAQVGIWIVLTILGILGFGSDLADVVSFIFSIVTTIMLLVFALKAWQGKPIHIGLVQELTDWFEEKITPKK